MNALFEPFVEKIHLFYEKACEDADVDPVMLPIVLEELSFNRSESEFAATPEPPRFTSPGMELRASGLSARGPSELPAPCSRQAANPENPPTELPVEGEMLSGTRCIELSVPLAKHRFDRWGDWARA